MILETRISMSKQVMANKKEKKKNDSKRRARKNRNSSKIRSNDL